MGRVHIIVTFSPREALSLLLLLSPILGKSLKILMVAVWGQVYVLFSVRKTRRWNLWWRWRWLGGGSRPDMPLHVWARLDSGSCTIRDVGRPIVIIHYLLKVPLIIISIATSPPINSIHDRNEWEITANHWQTQLSLPKYQDLQIKLIVAVNFAPSFRIAKHQPINQDNGNRPKTVFLNFFTNYS